MASSLQCREQVHRFLRARCGYEHVVMIEGRDDIAGNVFLRQRGRDSGSQSYAIERRIHSQDNPSVRSLETLEVASSKPDDVCRPLFFVDRGKEAGVGRHLSFGHEIVEQRVKEWIHRRDHGVCVADRHRYGLRQCGGSANRLFDALAALYDRIDIGKLADIRQRVAIDCDQVAPCARRDHADIAGLAQRVRGIHRRCLDCL